MAEGREEQRTSTIVRGFGRGAGFDGRYSVVRDLDVVEGGGRVVREVDAVKLHCAF